MIRLVVLVAARLLMLLSVICTFRVSPAREIAGFTVVDPGTELIAVNLMLLEACMLMSWPLASKSIPVIDEAALTVIVRDDDAIGAAL
jgi:hypothetical protein